VGTLIFINVALWLANGLFFTNEKIFRHAGYLTDGLLLRAGDIGLISNYYRFLTYGFVHDPHGWVHIFFNMFALLMFGYGMMLGYGPGGFGFVRGSNVEDRLGKLEFTAFYLLTIIIAGIAQVLVSLDTPKGTALGASGGVCGVVILYAWLYPRKTLLFWGILPMPMWAIGLLIVGMDAWGAAGYIGGNIAFSVHLVGAACGTLYYFLFFNGGIKLTGWLGSILQHKPKLRIHTPNDPPSDSLTDDEFNRMLDDVLKRYGEVGEAGLTPEEREFLQRASRRFAEKHRK
jgi:membrane associated rhomboid family serine protease